MLPPARYCGSPQGGALYVPIGVPTLEEEVPSGRGPVLIFITMGIGISLVAFAFGVAYITGSIQAPPAEPQSYRQEGIGLCVVAVISLLAFLLAVRWYAHQDGAEDDATAP